jgi:hypothetical protein
MSGCFPVERGGGEGTVKIHLADEASQSEVTPRLDFS